MVATERSVARIPKDATTERMFAIEQAAVDTFINNGVALVGHRRDREAQAPFTIVGGFVPAREHLLARGISANRIDRVFTPEGGIRTVECSLLDLYQMEPEVLKGWMGRALSPVDDLVDPSMSTIFPGGINLHGREHEDTVTERTDMLLIAAGADVATRRRGIIAARGHDLGNVLSRDYHSLLSPELLHRIVPEVLRSRPDWEIIRKAIIFHNVDSMTAIEPKWDKMNAEQKIAWLRELGPEACALFVADKTDVGRQRVNPLPYDVKVENFDKHTQLNLLSRTNTVELSQDGKALVWDMDFDPSMTEEEASVYPHLHKRRSDTGRIRAIAAAKEHFRHKEEGIPLVFSWTSQLWQLYHKRIELAILASFALFPDLDTFEIKVHDKEGNSRSILDMNLTVKREGLESDLEKLELMFTPKEKREAKKGVPVYGRTI